MTNDQSRDRTRLEAIARRVMIERGLQPDFSKAALDQLEKISAAAAPAGNTRDLTALLWASIDNDDSRDLDQLSAAVKDREGIKILVAIADVDALVPKSTPLDQRAGYNSTSVYTAAKIFPMLPEKLSTDLTSLAFDTNRLAIVIEMLIGADGSMKASDIYRALVRNKAKLAYNSVAAWLDGKTAAPEAVSAVPGMAENLKQQDLIAQKIRCFREDQGALTFDTIQAHARFDGDRIAALDAEHKNRATELIEDLMIAANGVVARFLAAKKLPSIRRVVRTPKRWDRIVAIAREHNFSLPAEPNSKALEQFLTQAKAADAERFPDLSLSVIKLLGAGEYVAEIPGDSAPPGHFSLSVKDYSHSTAPNRRFPDLLTQRLVKAALEGRSSGYSNGRLAELAAHCTKQEDAANKIERAVGKSAAALLVQSKIGAQFDAIVTGCTDKGTWVRILSLPVEGKLAEGAERVDVGDHVRVELVSTDVDRGFIDFKKIG